MELPPPYHKLWRWLGLPLLGLCLMVLSLKLTLLSPSFMHRFWADVSTERIVAEAAPSLIEQAARSTSEATVLSQSQSTDLTNQLTTVLDSRPITASLNTITDTLITWLNSPTDAALKTPVPLSAVREPVKQTMTAILRGQLDTQSAGQVSEAQLSELANQSLADTGLNSYLADKPLGEILPAKALAYGRTAKTVWQWLRLLGILAAAILLGLLLATLIGLGRQLTIAFAGLGRLFSHYAAWRLGPLLILRFILPPLLVRLAEQRLNTSLTLATLLDQTVGRASLRFIDVSIWLEAAVLAFGLACLATSHFTRHTQHPIRAQIL